MSVNIGQYFPRIYNGVYETDLIIYAENTMFDNFYTEKEKVANNQFVLTADEAGILAFERVLGIIAHPETEDLDFRRRRIINRLSSNLPFTEASLIAIMDNLVGVGMWSYEIDFNTYLLTIISLVPGENWLNELRITLNKIIPANMTMTVDIMHTTYRELKPYTYGFLGQFSYAEIRKGDVF